MRKYSTPVYLVVAIVALVIFGSSLNVIDVTFGTNFAAASGIWLALLVLILFCAYLVFAFKAWKKH